MLVCLYSDKAIYLLYILYKVRACLSKHKQEVKLSLEYLTVLPHSTFGAM